MVPSICLTIRGTILGAIDDPLWSLFTGVPATTASGLHCKLKAIVLDAYNCGLGGWAYWIHPWADSTCFSAKVFGSYWWLLDPRPSLDQFANATLQRGPPLFIGRVFQMILALYLRTLPQVHQIRRGHCPPYDCFEIDGSIRGPLGNIANIMSQLFSICSVRAC